MPRDVDQATLRRMKEVLDLAEIVTGDYSEFDLWDQTRVTRRMLTTHERGHLRDQAKNRLDEHQRLRIHTRRPN